MAGARAAHRARIRPLAIGTVLGLGLAAAGAAPARAQSTDFAALIFDTPCHELIGTTAQDMAGQNTVIAAIFSGFIAGRVPEAEARRLYDDLLGQSMGLGARCEFDGGSLYDAMAATVAAYLESR